MTDSGNDNHSPKQLKNRRRTLLLALIGAGAPLAQRTIPGEWVAPVVDTVLLPAHARTSPDDDSEKVLTVTGDFGSGDSAGAGSSLFENIVDRTEEEILDLFIRSAEAAGCPSTSCTSSAAATSVEVVATFNENSTGCVQAKVTLTGCTLGCLFFEYDATVNGASVNVDDSGCALQLNNATLTLAGFGGDWSISIDDPNLSDSGAFFAAANGDGCGSLSCPE